MELSIHVLHNLPGRVRIKFSRSLKAAEKLKDHVMEHEGIESMDYSDITSTMLVKYNNQIVELQEIMIRVSVAYSIENEMTPVKLTQKPAHNFITLKGIISGLSIISSALANMVSPMARFRKTLDWLSVITTSAAVFEHAGYDYRKKGSVDPEVFSLVFLAHWAISGRNMLLPSALTWVATFGRHFSPQEGEGILLEINKTGQEEKQAYYEVNVDKLDTKGSYIDVLNIFAEKFLSSETGFDNTIFEESKSLLKKHHKSLEGIGDKADGIVLHFNQQ